MKFDLGLKRQKNPLAICSLFWHEAVASTRKKLHGECCKGGISICFIQKLSFPNQNQPTFSLKPTKSCSGKPGILVSIFITTEPCGFGHSKTTLGCSHSLPGGSVWKMHKLGKVLFLCWKIRNGAACAHLPSKAHILYLGIVVFCLSRAQERLSTKPVT